MIFFLTSKFIINIREIQRVLSSKKRKSIIDIRPVPNIYNHTHSYPLENRILNPPNKNYIYKTNDPLPRVGPNKAHNSNLLHPLKLPF